MYILKMHPSPPRTPNKMMQNGTAKCIYYVNEKKKVVLEYGVFIYDL